MTLLKHQLPEFQANTVSRRVGVQRFGVMKAGHGEIAALRFGIPGAFMLLRGHFRSLGLGAFQRRLLVFLPLHHFSVFGHIKGRGRISLIQHTHQVLPHRKYKQ